MVENMVQQETQANLLERADSLRPSFRSLALADVANDSQKWQDTRYNMLALINPQERVVVYDPAGQERFAAGKGGLKNFQLQARDLPTLDDKGREFDVVQVSDQDHDKELHIYAEPLRNSQGEMLGYLQIIRQVPDIHPIQNRLFRLATTTSVLAVIILLALLYFYFRRINMPIQTINYQLARIAQHDYNQPYRPMQLAEFDEIGHSINRLAENLQAQEVQLSIQDHRMATLVDYLIIGVVLIDEDRKIQIVNNAFLNILDIKEDIMNKDYRQVIEGYRLIQLIDRAYQDKVNVSDEIYLYFPRELVLDVNVLYIKEDGLADDFNDQVIMLVYDITEIRRLEKVRSDFISNASHELKTPVTALQGFTETLLDGAIDDKETTIGFVKIMQKESNRLSALITDILDLARIEQDQVSHRQERVNANDLVEDIVIHLSPQAQNKSIAVNVNSPLERPVYFNGDYGRVSQVLTNLLVNAINYTPQNGQVDIVVDTIDDAFVVFKVQDNGIGIPREDLGRIFERFYRVSKSRSTDSGGTGLGLAIVKNLVKVMNGRIEVTSELGTGSTFTVYLPINDN
ncbi:two-component system histidine kinase PnpS [Aerococcus urinaehominis]|uniref:two-component system histidine kinase PnpS n=1 Tax=Aerococcus urinaehominis TaxID=128944 RepID=UPI0011789020|nr:HAMP domain-containing sensor histidine kinase [Aerococcus urinaehominis]